jgi:hypothetical protein
MSSQPALATYEPYRLPFYIRYKRIDPDPQLAGARPSYRSTFLKTPPIKKEEFLTRAFSDIYAWNPGTLQLVSPQDRPYLRLHKTSSVYWCPSQQTYLAVDYDCTAVSVKDRAKKDALDDWARLTFEHKSIGGQCVSVLGHRCTSEQLAAEAPITWKTELIPDAHRRESSPGPPGTYGPSLLAGDLSLLLGLAAASSPEDPKQTIQRCFRPHKHLRQWVRHNKSKTASKSHNIRV